MELLVAIRALRTRPWVWLVAAGVGPLVATGLRLAIGSALKGFPFITFLPVVVIAAFIDGWRAGIIAAVLSIMLAGTVIEPQLLVVTVWPSGLIAVVFFAVSCTIAIALIALLNTALDRLAATGAELQRLNRALEEKVAERTQQLEQANLNLRAEMATREAVEAQIRQAQKMESVGRLTGGIAHDFNNMLAIIIGSLDLARRRLGRGDTNILPALDNALDGANRAASLTRRLLSFSRLQPLDPAVIDPNALVRGMEELLRRAIGETITLDYDLSSDLWRTCIDPGQLESALLNLAVNARDAMPEGGCLLIQSRNGELDETYAATHPDTRSGDYAILAVTDSGLGMPTEVVARAFDPFFTTKGVGRGTGLGLSQVYGFVTQSNGHVQIDSELGRGTTVKLYLPRASPTEAAGTKASKSSSQAPLTNEVLPKEPLPKGRLEEIIFVVEDEAGVRRTTVDALRELGYSVRYAESPTEALAMLAGQPDVALLLTDIVMPEMTGRKLAALAVQRRSALKVLYTTGYAPHALIHDETLDPEVEVLMKPYALDQLARKVRHVLDAENGRWQM